MRLTRSIRLLSLIIASLSAGWPATAAAFDGRIGATLTQGNETNVLLYTVGTGQLRIENVSTNWPHPIDIVDLKTSALTLLFPHNRSFVRLKSGTGILPVSPGGGQAESLSHTLPMPGGLRPGIGPQPANLPAIQPSLPPMPAMRPLPMPAVMTEKLELKSTGQTTNLLGFACARYELKQRGETLEIWATDKLLPFQPYLRNQPSSFGPRMIEEQWPEMLTVKKLFPLLVISTLEHGPERSAAARAASPAADGRVSAALAPAAATPSDKGAPRAERYRFEVKSVKEEKITDPDGKLFHPPSGYHEVQPLPF